LFVCFVCCCCLIVFFCFLLLFGCGNNGVDMLNTKR
jgi:hypothetical protein